MEAVIVLIAFVIALASLGAASLTLGVDSRDGFTDDRRRPGLS
jgi:hypothetical protein